MPSQIAHILAGGEAIAAAGMGEARALVSASPQAFHLGCQGPDIFYHNHRSMPSGLHFGAILHRRGYGTMLAAAVDSIRSISKPEAAPAVDHAFLAAYVLGLSTHAALDRALHPFIIYFAGSRHQEGPGRSGFTGCHSLLERLLDSVLLAGLRGMPVEDFDTAAALIPVTIRAIQEQGGQYASAGGVDFSSIKSSDEPLPAPEAGLIRLWTAALEASCPRATANDPRLGSRILNALADSFHFYHLTNPADPGSRSLMASGFASLSSTHRRSLASFLYPDPQEIPLGLDTANLARTQWLHPSGVGEARTATAFECFFAGVADVKAQIAACVDALAGRIDAESLRDRVGDGCLGACQASGEPAVIKKTDPLPLTELLDRFARL